ncbi:galactose-3-O-sulfotransferase 2-like [Biomphalaria glabrata]|uniref:Galactose-3-O-sulfotransferase 2-like n=1 Tax=Biomphalaria glabrata TaxID=6526 RepID=A0A9W3BG07_BIOGL|nr:galactose-3-O-sulfotransferase 2-like [Biomphalaria glabrata]XP_055898376.1 galactose-3-O-sulfotransferase 2-like [Biomphalaria glabrata]
MFKRQKKALKFFILLLILSTLIYSRIKVDSLIPTWSHPVGHLSMHNREMTLNKAKCLPVRNIAFIKTHKTGSSTVSNILLNFGLANNLTAALPNFLKGHPYYNYITKPNEHFVKEMICPLTDGRQEYNLLFYHCVYNKTAFRSIMPENTVYISILREPFQQFLSSFFYYRIDISLVKDFPDLNNSMSIYSFLSSPYNFTKEENHFTYTRNKQAEDLGFREEHLRNNETLKQYLLGLEKDFLLVMIMEYFEESLLLLRRALCWEMEDIIYIPNNVNKKKEKLTFDEEYIQSHRRFSVLDYIVYDHFLKIFEEKLNSQDESFKAELDHFKRVLNLVQLGCATGNDVWVNESVWHQSFVVTQERCRLMTMGELDSLDLLFEVQGTKRTLNSTHSVRTLLY